MLERMTDQQFLLYVLTGLCAIVLIQKIIVSLIYGHLKRQTDNLPNSNGRWIRQIKQKFESTYRVSEEAVNVELFVDRQVAKLRFLKIGLHGMETFYRKAQLICLALGCCSYILAARAGKTLADCNVFFLMGGLAALVLQFLDNLSGNARSARIIRLNLREYLENMLMPKLASGEAVDRYMAANAERSNYGTAGTDCQNPVRAASASEFERSREQENRHRIGKEEIAAADTWTQKKYSREEEQRIVQDVLKEFLV